MQIRQNRTNRVFGGGCSKIEFFRVYQRYEHAKNIPTPIKPDHVIGMRVWMLWEVCVVEHGEVVGGAGRERVAVFVVMVLAQVNFRTPPFGVDIAPKTVYNGY
jgi:hypothetical protein